MPTTYPPLAPKQLAKLKTELDLIPRRFRQDAIQEAWVAHLEGRNPISTIKDYCRRELLHEERETPFSQTPHRGQVAVREG